MHKLDELLWLRNYRFVPCPSCPVAVVPVHVENHYVERNVMTFYLVHNVHKLLLCVFLIFAVPVAQRVERWHVHVPANLGIVAHGLAILMSVTHEIPVDGLFVHRLCPPVYASCFLVEREGGAAVAALG